MCMKNVHALWKILLWYFFFTDIVLFARSAGEKN